MEDNYTSCGQNSNSSSQGYSLVWTLIWCRQLKHSGISSRIGDTIQNGFKNLPLLLRLSIIYLLGFKLKFGKLIINALERRVKKWGRPKHERLLSWNKEIKPTYHIKLCNSHKNISGARERQQVDQLQASHQNTCN